MMRVALASAVAVVIATGSALAGPVAKLSDVSGSVLVDSGKGFQKVSSATEVSTGSRVLVSKGGTATLAYAAGCSKPLSANSITTVAGADACTGASQVAAQSDNTIGKCTNAAQNKSGKWVCYDWVPWTIGGAAVVGGLVGYAINGDDTNIQYIYVSG